MVEEWGKVKSKIMPLSFLVGVLLAKLMFSLAWSLQAKHAASSSGLIRSALTCMESEKSSPPRDNAKRHRPVICIRSFSKSALQAEIKTVIPSSFSSLGLISPSEETAADQWESVSLFLHMCDKYTYRVYIFGQISTYYFRCCKACKHLEIPRSMVLYHKYKPWTLIWGFKLSVNSAIKTEQESRMAPSTKRGHSSLLKSEYLSLYLFAINFLNSHF